MPSATSQPRPGCPRSIGSAAASATPEAGREVKVYICADARQALGLADLPPELLQCVADWLPTFRSRAQLRVLCRVAYGLEWRLAAPFHVDEELSGLGLSDIGAQALCAALQAPHNADLRELCLGANGIGDLGAKALAAALLAPRAALRRLSLRDNRIGDEGAAALAAALAKNSTLEELDLWGNCLSEHGKRLVLAAARCEVFVEAGSLACPGLRPAGTTLRMRKVLFDWLVQVHTGVHLPAPAVAAPDPQDMLFRTFGHIDAYLVQREVCRADFQVLGVAATWLAAGLAEGAGPEAAELLSWLSFVTDGACTAEELRHFAEQMGEVLGTQQHRPTSYTFLRRYLRRTGWSEESFSLANYYLELAAMDAAFLEFRPQAVAAAAAVMSRQYSSQGVAASHSPRWKAKLLQCAGVDLHRELAPCVAAMSRLHGAQAAQGDLFVNRKYQAPRLHGVARLRPHPPCNAAFFASYLAGVGAL